MQTLRLSPGEIAAHRGPRAAPRDPAPSRLRYRAHRVWLTPLYRSLLQIGVPLFLLITAVGWYVSLPEHRAAIVERVSEMRRSIETRPEFMVKLMAVEGASPVLADTIRALVPVDFPVSSFDLDIEAIQDAIAALDVVENVDIRVRPGGVMEVTVTEREPALVWRRRGAIQLIDATGHRIADLTDRGARADLPLVAGVGADLAAPQALELLRIAGTLAARVRGLERIGERRWDLVLDGGPRILLPETDPVRALEQVLAFDQAQDLLARDITHVDMRNPARPTLRLTRPAVDDLRRIKSETLE